MFVVSPKLCLKSIAHKCNNSILMIALQMQRGETRAHSSTQKAECTSTMPSYKHP